MADDDGGVLGNLPHSRPGRRSGKRPTSEAAEAPKPSDSVKTAAPRAKAKPKPKPKQAAPAKHAALPQPERRSNPVEDVLHVAGKVAGGGVRVAGGLAREIVRRLPRP